jgi:hypothetical protein
LTLNSPTSGGRSVGIVRSPTKATEFFILVFKWSIISSFLPSSLQFPFLNLFVLFTLGFCFFVVFLSLIFPSTFPTTAATFLIIQYLLTFIKVQPIVRGPLADYGHSDIFISSGALGPL